jgi:hypothetical protein
MEEGRYFNDKRGNALCRRGTSSHQILLKQPVFNDRNVLFIFYYHIVVLEAHYDIYKSAYNVS